MSVAYAFSPLVYIRIHPLSSLSLVCPFSPPSTKDTGPHIPYSGSELFELFQRSLGWSGFWKHAGPSERLRGCLTIKAWLVCVETAYDRASGCTSDTGDKSYAALCAIGPQKVKRERPELRPFSHWGFSEPYTFIIRNQPSGAASLLIWSGELNIRHPAGVCIGQGAYRPPRAGPRFSGDWRVGPSSNKSGCSAGPPRG